MTIGERMKALREKIGMSQVDFADKINVSKQTLYKYENNIITNIPSDKIEAAASLCGVSPAFIMGWSDKPSPSVTAFPAPLPAQIAAQYGEDMRELVETAAALDHDDRVLVRGEVLQMLKAEKYRKEKAGSAR